MLSISDMVQTLSTTGIFKPHSYIVRIQFPDRLFGAESTVSPTGFGIVRTNIGVFGRDELASEIQNLSLRAERATLPPITASTVDYPIDSAESIPIVKGRANPEPLAINFILSRDLRERSYFEYWINQMTGKNDRNYKPRFYDDYVGTITIDIITSVEERTGFGGFIPRARDNTETTILRTYIFKEVYPITVGDVEMSYGETDTYGTCAITFNWRDYENIDPSSTES
jgi:hypothetical protein